MATLVKRLNTIGNTVNVVQKVTYLKDVKTSGTNGGSSVAGSYLTRILNTQEGDLTFCSLSANQFTLQPGTYEIVANSPIYRGQVSKIKLRNMTDSSDTILGVAEYSANDTTHGDFTNNLLRGIFTISSSKLFEIQYRVSNAIAAEGLGRAATFGDNEIYTVVKITKIETLDEAY